MSMRRVHKRLLISLAVGVLSLPLFWWLFREVAVGYAMAATNAASRAELPEDQYFGMVLFLLVTAATLLASVVATIVIWFASGRASHNHSRRSSHAAKVR